MMVAEVGLGDGREIRYEYLGDWLAAMLEPPEGCTLYSADRPDLHCLGYRLGEMWHLVDPWRCSWFNTVAQREQVLSKLGLEEGSLVDMLRTPDGRSRLCTLAKARGLRNQ